jgi:hypothetical protein
MKDNLNILIMLEINGASKVRLKEDSCRAMCLYFQEILGINSL